MGLWNRIVHGEGDNAIRKELGFDVLTEEDSMQISLRKIPLWMGRAFRTAHEILNPEKRFFYGWQCPLIVPLKDHLTASFLMRYVELKPIHILILKFGIYTIHIGAPD